MLLVPVHLSLNPNLQSSSFSCSFLRLLILTSRRRRLPGPEGAPRDLPLGPPRAPAPLPVRARGGLHREEQAGEPVLQGHARHTDLLQVQQRVGAPEGPHRGGAGGRELR